MDYDDITFEKIVTAKAQGRQTAKEAWKEWLPWFVLVSIGAVVLTAYLLYMANGIR